MKENGLHSLRHDLSKLVLYQKDLQLISAYFLFYFLLTISYPNFFTNFSVCIAISLS